MAKITNEQIAEAMDMAIRMQLVSSINESIKKMTEFYKTLDFKAINIEKLKALADAFDAVVDVMEEKEDAKGL